VRDVWTTDLHGSRLVLGANGQAAVIEDIAVATSLQRLPTKSDVFALAQRENVLYTGLRNGGILRFDTRLQRTNSHPLFDSTSQRIRSSITGLKHLRDNQLLVSFLDGGISTFDLRFPIRTPLMTFTGNFNSYTNRLPLATDPQEKFLFAAGQDNRIRLWSLTTGGPALDPTGTGSTNQSVFERPFEHHVAALQVVEEREGLCLWAASGTENDRYNTGLQNNTEKKNSTGISQLWGRKNGRSCE
jgi:WD repeat-containing protein 21A